MAVCTLTVGAGGGQSLSRATCSRGYAERIKLPLPLKRNVLKSFDNSHSTYDSRAPDTPRYSADVFFKSQERARDRPHEQDGLGAFSLSLGVAQACGSGRPPGIWQGHVDSKLAPLACGRVRGTGRLIAGWLGLRIFDLITTVLQLAT